MCDCWTWEEKKKKKPSNRPMPLFSGAADLLNSRSVASMFPGSKIKQYPWTRPSMTTRRAQSKREKKVFYPLLCEKVNVRCMEVNGVAPDLAK